MKRVFVNVRLGPDRGYGDTRATVSAPQFENLAEAIDAMGVSQILTWINRNVALKAQFCARKALSDGRDVQDAVDEFFSPENGDKRWR